MHTMYRQYPIYAYFPSLPPFLFFFFTSLPPSLPSSSSSPPPFFFFSSFSFPSLPFCPFYFSTKQTKQLSYQFKIGHFILLYFTLLHFTLLDFHQILHFSEFWKFTTFHANVRFYFCYFRILVFSNLLHTTSQVLTVES